MLSLKFTLKTNSYELLRVNQDIKWSKQNTRKYLHFNNCLEEAFWGFHPILKFLFSVFHVYLIDLVYAQWFPKINRQNNSSQLKFHFKWMLTSFICRYYECYRWECWNHKLNLIKNFFITHNNITTSISIAIFNSLQSITSMPLPNFTELLFST